MTAPSLPQLVLIHDGDCPLCRKFVQVIKRLDTDEMIAVVSLEDEETQTRFPHVDMDQVRQQLTVCDQLNRAWHGVEALRRIAALLPAIRRLTWIYRLPGVTPAVGGLYRSVNRHRKRLCLKCGQKWMPSLKHSVRKRRGR